MAVTAVNGLSAGKRILASSFYSSDLACKLLFPSLDHGSSEFSFSSIKCITVSKSRSRLSSNISINRHTIPIKALNEHADIIVPAISRDPWFERPDLLDDDDPDLESSLEVFLLLQKSMLEKQWSLCFNQMSAVIEPTESCTKRTDEVISSGISARKRRVNTRRKCSRNSVHMRGMDKGKKLHSSVSPQLIDTKLTGYLRGTVVESHAEVLQLSKKIKAGLFLMAHKLKLKEKLGFQPSDKQLASSLQISRSELSSKIIECSLAKEKLAMSNVRLVKSIAKKYDNLGAEMADLVQGGRIGLLQGIEKFDSSKGFKISTYVYWWIRRGVSRALSENSRNLRLPSHLHQRLSSIRNAKIRLEERGITPSVDNLAVYLKISEKKVRNATKVVSKVFSLDKEVFPSPNGLQGETLSSCIADNNLENIPWHEFEEWSLKDEVNKLLCATISERERDIIRLYFGIDSECHTWEDISRQFGLSRERVRQVGLAALKKLKHDADKRRLDAMLVNH